MKKRADVGLAGVRTRRPREKFHEATEDVRREWAAMYRAAFSKLLPWSTRSKTAAAEADAFTIEYLERFPD